ncbi:hypothetical protein [Micromonospora haikouensis]|uniref:hypothetical protein n=1 Tax=Micromonospora haikouensis TaxID=686309 RepID=UPI003D736F7C
MLRLFMVCAGQYEDDAVIAVLEDEQDAKAFAAKYNAEKGYGINDGDRARVEPVRGFKAGDPGRSGHEIELAYTTHAFASAWNWRCACGEGGSETTKGEAAEAADRHIKHWAA